MFSPFKLPERLSITEEILQQSLCQRGISLSLEKHTVRCIALLILVRSAKNRQQIFRHAKVLQDLV
jgi:hypothetical protein